MTPLCEYYECMYNEIFRTLAKTPSILDTFGVDANVYDRVMLEG